MDLQCRIKGCTGNICSGLAVKCIHADIGNTVGKPDRFYFPTGLFCIPRAQGDTLGAGRIAQIIIVCVVRQCSVSGDYHFALTIHGRGNRISIRVRQRNTGCKFFRRMDMNQSLQTGCQICVNAPAVFCRLNNGDLGILSRCLIDISIKRRQIFRHRVICIGIFLVHVTRADILRLVLIPRVYITRCTLD